MTKRAFDVVVSAVALAVAAPIMAAVAAAIRRGSPGPIIYRAARVGVRGRIYTMHKFRTMHVQPSEARSVITATDDPRVSPTGAFLRRTKLDELPQLWDVLRGEMSVVGPRPEDPKIVRDHYTPPMMTTLQVKPGLTSPGSLYGTAHVDELLRADDAEQAYVDDVLPLKLALEQVYIERQSFWYDLQIIGRTVAMVLRALVGRDSEPVLPEMARARELLEIDV